MQSKKNAYEQISVDDSVQFRLCQYSVFPWSLVQNSLVGPGCLSLPWTEETCSQPYEHRQYRMAFFYRGQKKSMFNNNSQNNSRENSFISYFLCARCLSSAPLTTALWRSVISSWSPQGGVLGGVLSSSVYVCCTTSFLTRNLVCKVQITIQETDACTL